MLSDLTFLQYSLTFSEKASSISLSTSNSPYKLFVVLTQLQFYVSLCDYFDNCLPYITEAILHYLFSPASVEMEP